MCCVQGTGGVFADWLRIEPMIAEQIAAILRGLGNLLKTEESAILRSRAGNLLKTQEISDAAGLLKIQESKLTHSTHVWG